VVNYDPPAASGKKGNPAPALAAGCARTMACVRQNRRHQRMEEDDMNHAPTVIATDMTEVQPHSTPSQLPGCPPDQGSRPDGTRSGARAIRRLSLLVSAVLAVLFMAAGLASADVHNNNDLAYYDGEQGVGSTYIQCYPNLHKAYFTVDVSPTFGYGSGMQSLGAKVDSYRWNGVKYAYYSTTGWFYDNNDNHLTTSYFGGVQSGYWIHHVYYRWMEPNGQWTTLDEWINYYKQWVYHPSTGLYTSYIAQYCTT
jgi:hypothetical protein